MSTKRYRLKKDLPGVKAGSVFVYDGGVCTGNFYYCNPMRITREFVETEKDLFEPIKEEDKKERIRVTEFDEHDGLCDNERNFVYQFRTSEGIPAEKCNQIEKSIEAALNDDAGEQDKKFIDLTLSQLVEQSLAKGVIPIFQFVDKNELNKESSPSNKSEPDNVGKDWEVVEMKNDNGESHALITEENRQCGTGQTCKEAKCRIHSVRRLK